nr:hypothetical protein [Tanacetum cinerariifolium]
MRDVIGVLRDCLGTNSVRTIKCISNFEEWMKLVKGEVKEWVTVQLEAFRKMAKSLVGIFVFQFHTATIHTVCRVPAILSRAALRRTPFIFNGISKPFAVHLLCLTNDLRPTSYQMQDNSKYKFVHCHVFDHFANTNRIVPSAEYTSQQPFANTRNQHGTYMVQQHSVLPMKATTNARCSAQCNINFYILHIKSNLSCYQQTKKF